MITTFIRRKATEKTGLVEPGKELTPWEKIFLDKTEMKIKEEGTKLMMPEEDKTLNSDAVSLNGERKELREMGKQR